MGLWVELAVEGGGDGSIDSGDGGGGSGDCGEGDRLGRVEVAEGQELKAVSTTSAEDVG